MKRLLHILCILWLTLAPAGAQTNKQIRSLQKQQSALKSQIADQEKMLRSTKKDVNSQLANLRVISSQIDNQQKYVKGIHAELTELASDISGLEKQLSLLEHDLEDCKRKYRTAINYMFKNRLKFSQWRFILSARNFRQMYRRLRYVSDFSKYQRQQGLIIRKKEEEVDAKRKELLGVKQEKDRLYAEGQAETQKLEGQKKERQDMVDELNKKQKELQKTLAKQRKKYDQLNARIDQLIQQEIIAAEKRRKQQEAARKAREKKQREAAEAERRRKQQAARSKNNGKTTASKSKTKTATSKTNRTRSRTSSRDEEYHAPNPRIAENTDYALTASFAAARGRLPMPITGPYTITTHFGTYNVSGLKGVQLDSKGINITGHPGAQARCVYKGEVTAIFPYAGMYNVIVRHGSYMSVYCNLASITVTRGQQLSQRQTIGNVATDASGNCTLHFQLRKETARLNPEGWLAR